MSANGSQPLETFHQILPPSPQMRKKLTGRSSSWYQSNSCGRTATLHTLQAAGKNSHITPKSHNLVRTVEGKMGNRAELRPVAWVRGQDWGWGSQTLSVLPDQRLLWSFLGCSDFHRISGGGCRKGPDSLPSSLPQTHDQMETGISASAVSLFTCRGLQLCHYGHYHYGFLEVVRVIYNVSYDWFIAVENPFGLHSSSLLSTSGLLNAESSRVCQRHEGER